MIEKFTVNKEFLNNIKNDEYKDMIRLIVSVIYEIPRFDIESDLINVEVKDKEIIIYYDNNKILVLNTL